MREGSAMLKKLFAVAFGVALCVASSQNAHAVLITSNADFELVGDAPPPPGGDPLADIKIISGSGSTGNIFTNQTSGTPFSLGAGIRTVSAYAIAQATDGVQYQSV